MVVGSAGSATVGCSLSWAGVLEALGLPPLESAPPAITRCPVCRQLRLLILPDTILGGQWQWCQECRVGGDLVELAARAWQRQPEAAAEHLQVLGLSLGPVAGDLETQARTHWTQRALAQELWTAATQSRLLWGDAELQGILARVGVELPETAAPPDLAMVGAMSCRELVDRLGAKGDKPALFSRRTTGGPWKSALVFPCQDLPGRICGFLFVGRQGRLPQDYLFRPTPGCFRREDQVLQREAGLIYSPGMLAYLKDWDRTTVVCADPLLAAAWQTQQRQLGGQDLPLVAWPPTQLKARASWDCWLGVRRVFWSPYPSEEILWEAIATDAMVSSLGPREESPEALRDYLRRHGPEVLWHKVREAARPWPEALEAYLTRLTGSLREHAWMRLQTAGFDLTFLRSRLSSRLAKELLPSNTPVPDRRLRVAGNLVVEQEDGWYIQHKTGLPELVLGGRLRIDQVLHQPRLGQTHYQGRMLFQGQEYPFCLPREDLELNTFQRLKELLLEAGAGLLAYDHRWSRHGLFIAQQLQPPAFITGCDVVGWDNRRDSLSLPAGELQLGGGIVPRQQAVFPTDMPAAQLPLPKPLTEGQLSSLMQAGEAEPSLWALCCALAANVLAQAFGETSRGVGLVGAGSEQSLEWLSRCGCSSLYASPAHLRLTGVFMQRIRNRELHQPWPCWLSKAASARLPGYLEPPLDGEPRRVFVPVSEWFCDVQRMLRDWWCVRCPAAGPTAGPAGYSALWGQLLVNYLHDVCRRHLKLAASREPWPFSLGEDLLQYLREQSREAHLRKWRWPALEDYLCAGQAGESASGLLRVLARLIAEGRFQEPEFAAKSKQLAWKHEGEELQLVVPKAALSKHLLARQVVLADHVRVTANLQRDGVLRGEQPECWLLDGTWWTQGRAGYDADRTGRLKLTTGP